MRKGGGCRPHVTRWSPATGHPMPTAGRLTLFVGGCRFGGAAAPLGFVAAACFRARFLGGRGGGDETKSWSTRRGLGRFLSSIVPASSSRGGRRREMALPMQRWEALPLRAFISAGEQKGFQISKWLEPRSRGRVA